MTCANWLCKCELKCARRYTSPYTTRKENPQLSLRVICGLSPLETTEKTSVNQTTTISMTVECISVTLNLQQGYDHTVREVGALQVLVRALTAQNFSTSFKQFM